MASLLSMFEPILLLLYELSTGYYKGFSIRPDSPVLLLMALNWEWDQNPLSSNPTPVSNKFWEPI